MGKAIAKTVKLLLENGTQRGVMSIVDSSWNTGEMYSAPRESVDDLVKKEECNRFGVYLLLSKDMVYVGQSSDLSKRIKQHLTGKDWWDRVVILTTKDDSLTRSDIDYLEYYLIQKAKASNRLDSENKSRGNIPKVDKFRKPELEQYLEEGLFLLELIGINVFSDDTKRYQGKHESKENVPLRNDLRLAFWTAFNEYAFRNPEFAKEFHQRKASTHHWMDLSIGHSNSHLAITMIQKRSETGVQFHISDDKQLFYRLREQKEDIEKELGLSPDWQELPEKKASRIIITKPANFNDGGTWNEQFDWIMEMLLLFKKVFAPKVIGNPTEDTSVKDRFYCNMSGALATGFLTGEKMTVLAGSKVGDIKPSFKEKAYYKLRMRLEEDRTIHNGEFTRNYEFEHPSAASSVVMGRLSNGRTDWRTEDNTKLQDVV